MRLIDRLHLLLVLKKKKKDYEDGFHQVHAHEKMVLFQGKFRCVYRTSDNNLRLERGLIS